MTLAAGLHYNIPDEVYRADPCPEPSLTQSIAKTLLSRSPAHAKYMRQEPTTKYDIGIIAHRLILGRGRELEVLPSDIEDWRTKDARQSREGARAAGKLAVLAKDYDTAHDMRLEAIQQLVERGYGDDWSPERECGEVVAIASCDIDNPGSYVSDFPQFRYWLRALIDWLPSLARPWDYKTTSASAAPDAIHRLLPDWCIQAAMHERILNLIDPDNTGRREHRFVVQENYEPYALTVVRLTEAHMHIGRAQVARAEAKWARCVATGEWPAYPLEDATPEYPVWAMNRVMENDAD